MKVYNWTSRKKKRKELRNKSTYAEIWLWNELKNKKLYRKWRRQYSIGPYIVDFYCPSEKLVIELDGEEHFTEENLTFEQNRTNYIERYGIRILRFENQDVLYAMEYVLKTIQEYYKLK